MVLVFSDLFLVVANPDGNGPILPVHVWTVQLCQLQLVLVHARLITLALLLQQIKVLEMDQMVIQHKHAYHAR